MDCLRERDMKASSLYSKWNALIRFDIAVNEGLGVDVLQTRQKLIGQHQHRLELEAPPAVIE